MCGQTENSHLLHIVNVVSVASKIITKVSAQLYDSSRTGGRFVVMQNKGRKATEINTRIGTVSISKREKYHCLALEKGKRLQLHPEHWTSHESRNPGEWATRAGAGVSNLHEIEPWGQWGGAVRGKDLIFSFSGFPELCDEATMLVVAIILKQLDKEEVLSKISEERNPYLRHTLEVCL